MPYPEKSGGDYTEKSRSSMWYLLPILVGMIGGIIAYLVIRKDDPRKAKNCICIGLVMMLIGIIFNILLLGVDVSNNPGFNVNL
jgi:hypothetical protein